VSRNREKKQDRDLDVNGRIGKRDPPPVVSLREAIVPLIALRFLRELVDISRQILPKIAAKPDSHNRHDQIRRAPSRKVTIVHTVASPATRSAYAQLING